MSDTGSGGEPGGGAKKTLALHWQILIGIVIGLILGTAMYYSFVPRATLQVLGPGYTPEQIVERADEILTAVDALIKPTWQYQTLHGIAEIFMNLLKMIVIPLVFFSLVSGVSGMKEMRTLGRMGAKTAGWYLMTSLIAIATGLLLVNIIQPGVGKVIPVPSEAPSAGVPDSFWEVIVSMVPSNVFKSMATFDLFGVIFFAILFGVFMLAIEEEKRKPMVALVESAAAIMMKMTEFIISLAPIGVAALIGRLVAVTGPSVFLKLIGYVVTVSVGLSFHVFVTMPLLTWLFTRRNAYKYMKAMSSVLLTGFSTASSAGTLSLTMERANKGAGIHERITSFVLPLGATVNMDGTALYECVTVLFLAQVHASVDPTFSLTLAQQGMVVFLALAISIGAAGIPHAGLVMMIIILQAVNLPIAYAGVIWAVDRVLDMMRTVVNVWSDSTGALVIAHSEGAIDETVLFGAPGSSP